MSLDAIRTQVKTTIETVSGIGKVYDYERYTHDWKQYNRLFTKNDKLNTWQIERPTFTRWIEATSGASTGVERVVHHLVIRGFYALNDELESEKTFQDLMEAVTQVFRSDATLNSTAETIIESRSMPMTGTIYKDFLGAVLCHIGEINISIQEKVVF